MIHYCDKEEHTFFIRISCSGCDTIKEITMKRPCKHTMVSFLNDSVVEYKNMGCMRCKQATVAMYFICRPDAYDSDCVDFYKDDVECSTHLLVRNMDKK